MAAPEEIRLRYLYRTAILRGRVRVTLDAARRLVGPDCAFHLYAAGAGEGSGASAGKEGDDSRCPPS
jgi:hypothetical protein